MLLLLLIPLGSGFATGRELQRYQGAPVLAELTIKNTQLEANAENWHQVAEHYRFYLDKMCYDNKQAKADIEELTAALRTLKAERDVYYDALHEYLNLPIN